MNVISMLRLIIFCAALCLGSSPAFAARVQDKSDSVSTSQMALNLCLTHIKQAAANISLQQCEQLQQQIDAAKHPVIAAQMVLALYDINLELGKSSVAKDLLLSVKQSPAFQASLEVQYLWSRKQATYWLYNKDYEQAGELFQRAFQIADSQASAVWLAKSYNDLALIEQYSNNYAKALEYYQQSLRIKEQLGNHFHTAITLNNLGLIYKKLEKYTESQRYFELSLDHYLEYTSSNPDKTVIGYMAHLYGNLAEIYNINNDFHKKYYYSNKVIAAYNEALTGDDRLAALINLAKIHINAAEFEPAREVVNTLTEYLEVQTHSFHDVIYLLKAQIYAYEKNTKLAIQHIENAMDVSDNKQDSLQKMNIYHYASELYHDNGRPYEAIIYLKKYQVLHEALLEKKYSENIKVIQSDIENERVQRALAEQQVINQKKTLEIDQLIKLALSFVSVILILGFMVAFYMFKKRKAQQHLQTIIESHKQQLFLLSNEDVADNSDEDEIEATETRVQTNQAGSSTGLGSSKVQRPFAELLVETMIDCIAIWERTTQTNKVELADRSQIWKISIDSGRLRTRSLDKYLTMKKLPDNPRWRNVVKTCHFILSECQLSTDDRGLLTTHLDSIMLTVKRESMQGSE